jgi:hypothetical protein
VLRIPHLHSAAVAFPIARDQERNFASGAITLSDKECSRGSSEHARCKLIGRNALGRSDIGDVYGLGSARLRTRRADVRDERKEQSYRGCNSEQSGKAYLESLPLKPTGSCRLWSNVNRGRQLSLARLGKM